MIHKGFEIYVRARVTFTRDEVQLLQYLATGHYDAWCKSFGKPDGLLDRMARIMATMELQSIEEMLDFRQIDTLAKISEPTMGIASTQATKIHFELRKVLMAINEKFRELNL